jgi:hypothetical protein
MRVRNKSYYRYVPVGLDRFDPPHGVQAGILVPGDTVQVKSLPGCPPANSMGHAHIVTLTGEFAGLVCCNSLEPLAEG